MSTLSAIFDYSLDQPIGHSTSIVIDISATSRSYHSEVHRLSSRFLLHVTGLGATLRYEKALSRNNPGTQGIPSFKVLSAAIAGTLKPSKGAIALAITPAKRTCSAHTANTRHTTRQECEYISVTWSVSPYRLRLASAWREVSSAERQLPRI